MSFDQVFSSFSVLHTVKFGIAQISQFARARDAEKILIKLSAAGTGANGGVSGVFLGIKVI